MTLLDVLSQSIPYSLLLLVLSGGIGWMTARLFEESDGGEA